MEHPKQGEPLHASGQYHAAHSQGQADAEPHRQRFVPRTACTGIALVGDRPCVRNRQTRFRHQPLLLCIASSRTLDPDEFYTRNYTPFNIKDELSKNYMDLNVSDVKFQAELKWKITPKVEVSALGAIKYQASSTEHHIEDSSTRRRPTVRWPPQSFRATIPTFTTIPMSRTVTNTRSFPRVVSTNGATSAPRAAISGLRSATTTRSTTSTF